MGTKGEKIMTKRRSNGEGHIYKHKKGHWEGMLTKGYDENGKQKFRYFTGKTKQDVLDKIQTYKEQTKKGVNVDFTRITVGEWLDYWYENYSIGNTKTPTRVGDESIVKKHLKPNIGHIKLQEFKGIQAQIVYKQMQIDGRLDKKGGLNAKTIKNIHLVLHRAMEQAVRNDLIIKNPLKGVILPRREKKEIEILSVEEQRQLELACTPDNSWNMAIILDLYSGMRLGELLGLTWKDVNFEKNTISINKQLNRLRDYDENARLKTKLGLRNETKTKTSERIIAIAPVIMEKLKRHKLEQDKLRLRWSHEYKPYGMVFCMDDGNYVDPRTFRDQYHRILKKSNIGHKTFHALRHTFATRALETNAHVKVVSEILGHASIQITLDAYSHVSPSLQQDAMQKLAESFLVA